MSSPFEVSFSREIQQVTREVQLATVAAEAVVQNTSGAGVNVVLNAGGTALLDGTGVVLEPGQSTTVALQAQNGAALILSAIATGPDASILVTMTEPTIDPGVVIVEPGTPLVPPHE